MKIQEQTRTVASGYLALVLLPILTLLFGWLILGEEISRSLGLALVLVSIGIVMINRKQRQ